MLLLLGMLTLSFFSTLALTPVAIAFARRFGYLDKPSSRKIHIVPTPLFGGSAVLLGFTITFIIGIISAGIAGGGVITGYIIGAVIIFAVGLIDDALDITPGSKFFGQILTAILFLVFSKAGGILKNTPLDFTIALLWMVTLMNALNFLDNMDGLCTGISFAAALGFTVLGFASSEPLLVVMGISLMGALMGFMYFNLNPARIFLGDAGSMFLGYTLGSMGVMFAVNHPLPQDLLAPLLIMSYPLFDISFVTFTRLREGRPMSQGGKDHTSHRLVNLGIRSSKAVWGIFVICLLLALLGNLIYISPDSTWKLIAVVLVAFLLLVFGIHLNRNFANIKEKILLIFADSLGLNVAFLVFYYIRFSSGIFEPPMDIPIKEFITAAIWINFYWFFVFGILGQYEFTWDRYLRVEMIKLIKAVFIGTLIFLLMTLDFSEFLAYSIHLFFYGLLVIIFIGLLRLFILLAFRYYNSRGLSKRRTIVVGDELSYNDFRERVSDKLKLGMEIIGRVSFYQNDNDVLGPISELSKFVKKYRVSDVIILNAEYKGKSMADVIQLGNFMDITFKAPAYLMDTIRGLKTERLYGGEMFKIYSERMRTWEWGIKRLTDIIGAVILLIITSPLLLLCALAVRLYIGHPVLIKRKYIGLGGEKIGIPKFRISRNEIAEAESKTAIPDNAVGRILHITKLEYIPGILALLKGEISLVGPEPNIKEESLPLMGTLSPYNERWKVKPGIINLTRLLDKTLPPDEYNRKKLEYDLRYSERMSMLYDTKITTAVVLRLLGKIFT